MLSYAFIACEQALMSSKWVAGEWGEGGEREPARTLLFFEFHPRKLRRAICHILSNEHTLEIYSTCYCKRFCNETLAFDSKPTFIERIFTENNKMYVLVRAKLQRHQNKSKRLAIVNVHKDQPQFIHARSRVDF